MGLNFKFFIGDIVTATDHRNEPLVRGPAVVTAVVVQNMDGQTGKWNDPPPIGLDEIPKIQYGVDPLPDSPVRKHSWYDGANLELVEEGPLRFRMDSSRFRLGAAHVRPERGSNE